MGDRDDATIDLGTGSLKSQAGCPDRYEIKGLIGQGGMGMVFRAFDQLLSRDVAIKILLFEGIRQEEAQERFLREAKALALLDHANIVKIFSSGLNQHGNPYHVIELLNGESLAAILKKAPLNAARFFAVFDQVLAGLEHAHSLQIVHRDLKPSNIMCCKSVEGSDIVKLIDFGIARIDMSPGQVAKTITQTDAILGSPDYMSPEQCRGQRGDQRSDIYSLGCIMYECIAGHTPFQGSSALDSMYKHMTEPSLRLDKETMSAKSKQLASLVAGCLEKNPEDRPQSAAEIAVFFRQIFEKNMDEIELLSGRRRPLISKNNRVWLFASITILLLALSGIAGYLYLAEHSARVKGKFEKAIMMTRLERLQQKCRNWKKLETQSPKFEIAERRRYLFDLLALGREQLNPKAKTDSAAAEQTYSCALALCKGTKSLDSKDNLAACLVLKAKSEWMQRKYKIAAADFDQAVNLFSEGNLDAEMLIDIYLEKTRFGLAARNFAGAYSDYLKVAELFRSCGKLLLELRVQKLDKDGDDRLTMIFRIDDELRRLSPQSREEAIQMVKLANRLAKSEIKMNSKDRASELVNYSVSLLPRIQGEDELKKETMAEYMEYRK